MNLSWHNTDEVWDSSRLTYFYRSYCPLLRFSFLDFSLQSFEILTSNLVQCIWICHHIIQIKFEFCHAWPTFIGVIALCTTFSFSDFSPQSFEILASNLAYEFVFTFYRSILLIYCPLLKFSFPHFSMSPYKIMTWFFGGLISNKKKRSYVTCAPLICFCRSYASWKICWGR